jgi:hypothetical protein
MAALVFAENLARFLIELLARVRELLIDFRHKASIEYVAWKTAPSAV